VGAQQAIASVEYMAATFPNAATLKLRVQSMVDALDFDPDQQSADAAEAAMRDLGLLLGFVATRPEKEGSGGPDVCWGLS